MVHILDVFSFKLKQHQMEIALLKLLTVKENSYNSR